MCGSSWDVQLGVNFSLCTIKINKLPLFLKAVLTVLCNICFEADGLQRDSRSQRILN